MWMLWQTTPSWRVPCKRENMRLMQQQRTFCERLPYQEARKNIRTKQQWNKNRRIHTATQDENSDSNEEYYFHSIRNLPANAAEAYAKLKIGNKQGQITVKAKIDTGAMSNLLPKTLYKKLTGINLEKSPIRLIAFGGAVINQEGTCRVGVRFRDRHIITTFHVVNSQGPMLIGLKSSRDLGLVTLNLAVKSDTPATAVQSGEDQRPQHKTKPIPMPRSSLKGKKTRMEILKQKEKSKEYYNRQNSRQHSRLHAGQKVSVQHEKTRLWEPGMIRHHDTHPRSYIVESESGNIHRRNRQYIRPAKGDPIRNNDDQPPTTEAAYNSTSTPLLQYTQQSSSVTEPNQVIIPEEQAQPMLVKQPTSESPISRHYRPVPKPRRSMRCVKIPQRLDL